MRRDLRVVVNAFAEYQIGFGNEFHIKSMDGYNIKSTSFKVSGFTQDLYISDILFLGEEVDQRMEGTM